MPAPATVPPMSAPLPPVTIAVLAYNHDRYVLQTLDSMLDSGIPDLEIVVCDDASSDRTADLIEAWGARQGGRFRRFCLIRHPRNMGLCSSLNDLIKASRGDLIHVIASDDYFLPGGLLAKTRAMVDHPEWQVAFCDGQAVGPEGDLYLSSLVADSPYLPAQLTPEGIGGELLYHWGPPAHQMTWRRTAFKAHGGAFEYDPTVFCEDYDSALWAAGHRILGYIPVVCQAYRYRSWPQTTNRNSIREFRDNSHVLAKHAHLFAPHLRQGLRLLSSIYFHMALGDSAQADTLWREHRANRKAYEARMADPAGHPLPEVRETEGSHLLDSLNGQIPWLVQQFAETREKLRMAREQAKDRDAALAALKQELKATRHLLRHHAANPLRALGLWWNRRRPRG